VARQGASKKAAQPRVVWITRAEPGASATAERVRALGLEPIVEPLIGVRPITDAAIDLRGVCALVFTSANAVAAFAERSPEREIRVFAVGDATAAAAKTQRFKSVLSAQGDVKALAAALAARRRELTGVVYYLAAAEPAVDLTAELTEAGLDMRETALYETAPRDLPADFAARLPGIDAVLVHSGKSARLLGQYVKANPAPHLAAFCMSLNAARPIARAGLAAVLCAPVPSEAALLRLLSDGQGAAPAGV
jgi:uroporphyrinogen-III synthase